MTQLPDQIRGRLYAVVGISILSPDALLIRLVSANAYILVFWRGILSAVMLLGWLLARRRGTLLWSFRAIGELGLLAASLHTVTALLFVLALKQTAVANVFVITGAQPLVGAILSSILLKEHIRRSTWVAGALVAIGLGIVFWGSVSRGNPLGDIMAFGAMILVALRYVLFRAAREVNMTPTIVVGGILTAVVLGPFINPTDISLNDLVMLFLMGGVLLPIAQVMLIAAPRYMPVPELSLIVLLEAVLAPLWVWLVLGETPSFETVAGGVLILATLGVYFYSLATRSR